MSDRLRLLRRGGLCIAASTVLGALLAVSSPADAGRAPLALGSVTTKVSRRSEGLEQAFRGMVERELTAMDLSNVKSSEHYVLSAALVKMETSSNTERARTTCVVSATLTREKGGALHAVIQGRARAEEAPSEARTAELSAMRAAVHSALKRVPEALK